MPRPSAPRYDIEISVQLVTASPARAVSRNISSSGMLVRSSRPLSKGTRVRLEPLLAGGVAEVVWTRETRTGAEDAPSGVDIGLKFVSLPQHDRDTVSALIRSLERTKMSRML